MMFVAAVSGFVGGGARAASCAAAKSVWPTFCAIPAPPTGVKSPAAVHAEVLDIRLAGRALVRANGPSTYTLSDTAGFAARATTEAAPPPPLTTSSQADTAAFAAEAKAAVAPPKHPR